MKTINKLTFKIFLITVIISLQGCLDIYFTTELHPNGQIDKTIVIEGDSASILKSHLPAASNKSWENEWVKIEDDKYKLILSKSFNNVKSFNEDLNPEDSLPAIRLNATLKKRFRWFFSYFDYQENLLPNNPFQRVDWKEYLNEDEVELIGMDEELRENDPRFIDSTNYKTIEIKFEEYLYRSSFEEFYQLFLLAAIETPGSEISKNLLYSNKEAIFQKLKNNNKGIADFISAFKTQLGDQEVEQIITQNPDYFEYFNYKMDFFDECLDDNYYFNIKMPGLLLGTNSEEIKGSLLSWEVDFFDFYFNGLSMKAESRIVNMWAVIISGVIVLVLLIGLIVTTLGLSRSV